ncbi:MAG: hypothetical protein KAU94_07400 [Verrucomicrobia bacterium]|nr:hypothetical protein [Verrucomicrobiota bacterium]
MKKIPCHIIAGQLGSGKTTAILDFLHRRRNNEFTAVLVNDYGPNGIDSSVLADAEAASKVINIPGGCLCCTSAINFKETFGKLTRMPRVDRIIVEPSGIVLLDELLKTMEDLAKETPIVVRPVILLAEPSSFNQQRMRGIQYGERLAELADIVIANFSDLTAPEETKQFIEWAHTLSPSKLKIQSTAFGKLPDEVFDMTSRIRRRQPSCKRPPVSGHNQYPGGLQLDQNLVFKPKVLSSTIQQIAQYGMGDAVISRFKGIFQTLEKPILFEIAHGRVFQRELENAPGNTLDWIASKRINPIAMHKIIQQD